MAVPARLEPRVLAKPDIVEISGVAYEFLRFILSSTPQTDRTDTVSRVGRGKIQGGIARKKQVCLSDECPQWFYRSG